MIVTIVCALHVFLGMANQGGNSMLRDYRKGNWTVQETMVLIEAKKMDEERRMKRHGEIDQSRNKPAELRWKWVEDYCWKNGCLRSQNQCNDKWDNLMRDFKRVRDYERRVVEEDNNNKSYWKIEKSVRKERNLPSNMLFGIYEALVEVIERKCFRVVGGGGSGGGGGGSTNMAYVLERVSTSVQLLPTLPPLVQPRQPIASPTALTILPLPPPQSQPQPPPPLQPQPPPPPPPQQQQPQQPFSLPYALPLPIVDSSDTSEYSDSPAKRRRKRRGKGEGTSTTGNASGTTSDDFGSAITKSASIIAEAIQAGEEREERRHKDLLNLHEKRLQIEESKAEINRQGINGLVDAINNLSNSILALATNKNNPPP